MTPDLLGRVKFLGILVAELQYLASACLENLQRQLREDTELAALLRAEPALSRDDPAR